MRSGRPASAGSTRRSIRSPAERLRIESRVPRRRAAPLAARGYGARGHGRLLDAGGRRAGHPPRPGHGLAHGRRRSPAERLRDGVVSGVSRRLRGDAPRGAPDEGHSGPRVRRAGGAPARGRSDASAHRRAEYSSASRPTGVNPYDTYMRNGTYAIKPPLPYTPGSDASGAVESVGAGVTRVKPGTASTPPPR